MNTARQAFTLALIVLLLAVLGCKAADGRWRNDAAPAVSITPTLALLPLPTMVAAPALTPLLPTAVPPTPVLPAPTIAVPLTPLPSATSLPSPTAAAPTPEASPPFTPNAAATVRQSTVFEELWNVIAEQYLYPDFNGLDWEAVGREYRARIAAGISDEDFHLAMHEMVDRLGDEHSYFFSPDEARQSDLEFEGESSYVGIGVLTTAIPERQRLAVLLVFPGSPAEAAGVRIHDSLLAVDGEPVVDADGTRRNNLRGPEGSTIRLSIQSPGEAPRDVSITRRAVSAASPVHSRVLTTAAGKRIGYIFLPTFNESGIDDQVGRALTEMAAGGSLSGIIIDNRYNGGGTSDVLMNTISYFTDGPIGFFVERSNESRLRVRGQDIGGSLTIPLVVLIGEGTVSFGEVFAGSLKDLGRAYLIGEVTDGNVEVLSIFNFSDGSRAWIATSTFRPVNDRSQNWEETGIIPDQIVVSDWDLFTEQTDPAILAAQAYFDSLAQP